MVYDVQCGDMRSARTECIRRLQDIGCTKEKANAAFDVAWHDFSDIRNELNPNKKEELKAIRSLYRKR